MSGSTYWLAKLHPQKQPFTLCHALHLDVNLIREYIWYSLKWYACWSSYSLYTYISLIHPSMCIFIHIYIYVYCTYAVRHCKKIYKIDILVAKLEIRTQRARSKMVKAPWNAIRQQNSPPSQLESNLLKRACKLSWGIHIQAGLKLKVSALYCFMLPSHSSALSCLAVQGSEASSKVLGQWTGSVLLLYHIIVICHYVHCFGSRAMNLLPSFLSHVTGRQCPVAHST